MLIVTETALVCVGSFSVVNLICFNACIFTHSRVKFAFTSFSFFFCRYTKTNAINAIISKRKREEGKQNICPFAVCGFPSSAKTGVLHYAAVRWKPTYPQCPRAFIQWTLNAFHGPQGNRIYSVHS